MSWRLALPLASAAAIMSNGTFSSSMSSSKSCSRCIRAKLCSTAVATIITRLFAKAVRSPKCRHGKRRFSNPKHLSIIHLVRLYAVLWCTHPAFFGLRIGVNKYALQAYPLSPRRMPSRTPSLYLSAMLLFSKMRES